MGGMQLELRLEAQAQDEDGNDVCAEHWRQMNEGGHAWMYAWIDDPDSDLAAAYRAIGMSPDMLLVCTLCRAKPCPRESCPLWNKGKRSLTPEEQEMLEALLCEELK
jgi:hypothetical protein